VAGGQFYQTVADAIAHTGCSELNPQTPSANTLLSFKMEAARKWGMDRKPKEEWGNGHL
jgi:hypothetical protein